MREKILTWEKVHLVVILPYTNVKNIFQLWVCFSWYNKKGRKVFSKFIATRGREIISHTNEKERDISLSYLPWRRRENMVPGMPYIGPNTYRSNLLVAIQNSFWFHGSTIFTACANANINYRDYAKFYNRDVRTMQYLNLWYYFDLWYNWLVTTWILVNWTSLSWSNGIIWYHQISWKSFIDNPHVYREFQYQCQPSIGNMMLPAII